MKTNLCSCRCIVRKFVVNRHLTCIEKWMGHPFRRAKNHASINRICRYCWLRKQYFFDELAARCCECSTHLYVWNTAVSAAMIFISTILFFFCFFVSNVFPRKIPLQYFLLLSIAMLCNWFCFITRNSLTTHLFWWVQSSVS